MTGLKAAQAVTQVSLDPLTVEDTFALIASLEQREAGTGQTTEAPARATTIVHHPEFKTFAKALFDETSGQPLYLAETIKHLLEQRVLLPYASEVETAGVRWKTLAGETTGHFALPRIIPTSVREAILDRFARLTPAAEAYPISQSIANVWGQSFSQMAIGAILWDRGEPAEALAVTEECLRLAEQANYLIPQILTRTDLGAIYASFGDHQQWIEQMNLALQLADTRLPVYRPYVMDLLARQHLLYNQLNEAEALIEQAKTVSNPHSLSFLIQWVHFAEAELALRQGSFERVLAVTDAILAAIAQSRMRFLLSGTFRAWAVLSAMDEPEQARTLLEAHADAEQSGSRYKLMQILTALASLERDPMQAEPLLQQAAAIKTYILSHSPPHLRAKFLNQRSAAETRPPSPLPIHSPTLRD